MVNSLAGVPVVGTFLALVKHLPSVNQTFSPASALRLRHYVEHTPSVANQAHVGVTKIARNPACVFVVFVSIFATIHTRKALVARMLATC